MKKKTIQEATKEVQKYLSLSYANTVTNDDDNKEQLTKYIDKYIDDNRIEVEGYSKAKLVNKIYIKLFKYGVLTEYLEQNDVEEIYIVSWNTIKIFKSGGRVELLEETFDSPEDAKDTIKRLLRESGVILDNANPIARGHLGSKIRVTVLYEGVVDDNIGIMASIRIVNPNELTKEDFVNFNTATHEMLDFVTIAHKYGASTCFVGATSSGKTTLMSLILSSIENEKVLFTIEESTREFNKHRKEEINGKLQTVNSVVHTKTSHAKDEKQSITMEKLLETSLTCNPDYICVAEMKSREAFSAQEASRSGHTVSTTVHASSCREAYDRMFTLCKLTANITDKVLFKMLYKAFPIMVYCKKLADDSRKIMEITECVVIEDENNLEDYTVQINTLFKFDIEKNVVEDGKVKVVGEFKKINDISKQMIEKLKQNGITDEELQLLVCDM